MEAPHEGPPWLDWDSPCLIEGYNSIFNYLEKAKSESTGSNDIKLT